MYLTTFFIGLCLIGTGCFATDADVVDLGDNDFEDRLKDFEAALVMFYAPWCGHCKKLKPEYSKAAEDLLRYDPPVHLVKVDCTEAGKETCSKHGVSGYPTLKIFKRGEMTQEYQGPRDANGIVKYMKSQVGPSSKEVQTLDELTAFIGLENEHTIVGFFEKETDLKATFAKVADKLNDKIRFAHTTNKNVLEHHKQTNNVVLFRAPNLQNMFEPKTVAYSGSDEAEKLEAFIKDNYHGLVGHRKPDNKADFRNPLIVAYYNVDFVRNAKMTAYFRNRICKVAKTHNDLTFAVSNKDEFQHELNEYGVDYIQGDKPKILARDSQNRKFEMKEEFSTEALEQFVQELQGGRLEAYLKSEAIPEANNEPVKVGVAKNFDELVKNADKDVLIEFYAPWCGHCKKLAPVFDEVALKLDGEDVLLVKYDATANDVPAEYDVRGFPTLYWQPRGGNAVRYEGGREAPDFIAYIAKHASNELTAFDRSGKATGKSKSAAKTEL